MRRRPDSSPGRARRLLETLVAEAGLAFDGEHPWDPQIHDDRFYERVLRNGSLGLGESYMDGWWDVERLDETFHRFLRADLGDRLHGARTRLRLLGAVLASYARRPRAYEIAKRHYDLGNDLFLAMLDKRMNYSCAYWGENETLDAAQEAKLDLVCRKIGLRSGDRVLDIGCGWGGFLQFAAERYGARGLGVTVSREQVELARVRTAGLPVEIRLQDYRTLAEPEPFDHVVSLGMFEHVGVRSHPVFMRVVHRLLKDDGLFLLHTIGGDRSVRTSDPWIGKYIFPGSLLPSISQIGRAIETRFVMEDWHNFSADYERTLLAWHASFEGAWERLQTRYDERFRRMWSYYLLSCAGMFRARTVQLWQVVLAPRGVPGGYRSVR